MPWSPRDVKEVSQLHVDADTSSMSSRGQDDDLPKGQSQAVSQGSLVTALEEIPAAPVVPLADDAHA